MTLYVVMVAHRFADLTLGPNAALPPVPYRIKPGAGFPTHYLPAFTTREAAEQYAEGRWPVVEMATEREGGEPA